MRMSAPIHTDRREYPRQIMRGYARLVHSQNSQSARLLDMSAGGAGLAVDEEDLLTTGDDVLLTIDLSDIHLPRISDSTDSAPGKTLYMRGTLVHLYNHMAGVECHPATEVDEVLLAMLLAKMD